MKKDDLNVLMDFLRIPLESAERVFEAFSTIPNCIQRGKGLGRFLYVPGTRENKVLLVAHADTCWDGAYRDAKVEQKISSRKGIVRNLKGGLGADDRAGCALVWLLKETGHSLLITHGEERGCRGSEFLMHANPDIADEINAIHQFAVQLDRRNSRDFVCYTVGTDVFRRYVRQMTGYSEPARSSYSDIGTLCRDICGVNLSIGYYNEHSVDEYLVVDEWLATLNMCRKWLAKHELPRFRLNGTGNSRGVT